MDDQALFRRVAREVIDATEGFEALGEAASGEEALTLVAELDPDLVLIDVRMPGMDGLETARRLSAANPRWRIVLISTESATDLPTGTACCGAVGLLAKEDFGTATLQRLWTCHGPRPRP